MKLSERDQKLVWHPFTQGKTASPPLGIVRGKGAYLYTEEGEKLLDLLSSWWVNLHGHAHPSIVKAIARQAKTLEHVLFAGCTHEPAVQLCESLHTVLPKTLSRFFFSDNGSTAVEVALKMAFQFWANTGKKRETFLHFQNGYHGDTIGAMSVGRSSGFYDPFLSLLFPSDTIPFPATWENDTSCEQKERESLAALEKVLQQRKGTIAAIIIEPLIQGAGGMRICRPEFLQAVIDRVKEEQIFVIFDEAMTGFGRTGTLFALEQVDRIPDFLCLAKGLSGGFSPLALTITQEHIYEAFLGPSFRSAFAHGHSFTAHPLGCAAAVASLQLLQKSSTKKRIENIRTIQRTWIQPFQETSGIFHTRQLGTMFAFDLSPKPLYGSLSTQQIVKQLRDHNLFVRPLGDTIYLLPPFCISKGELNNALSTILRIVSTTVQGKGI
jgi:adenosylmethionine-8-amino-7-oxononanoate aminotransferase